MADEPMPPAVTDTPPATPAMAKPWIFSAEEIEASPSRQDGMPVEEEREVRKTMSKLIAIIGQGMVHKKASLLAINSGKVFFHRVFMVQSLKKQNPRLVAITCLWLACKSEECLQPLRNIIWTLNKLDVDPSTNSPSYPFGRRSMQAKKPDGTLLPGQENWRIEEDSEGFQMIRANIISCERVCLHILGFQLNVCHPVAYMRPFMDFLDARRKDKETRTLVIREDDSSRSEPSEFGRDIMHTANAVANDATSITVCLQYEAGVVAAGCLAIALKTKKFQMAKMGKWTGELTEQCAKWAPDNDLFQDLVVRKEDVEDFVTQMLDLYDESNAEQKGGEAHASASRAPQDGEAAAAPAAPPPPAPAAHSVPPSSAQEAPKPSTNGGAGGGQQPAAPRGGQPAAAPGGQHPAASGAAGAARPAAPGGGGGHGSSGVTFPSAAAAARPPGLSAQSANQGDASGKLKMLEAGEKVLVAGSARGSPGYELLKNGAVYSCTCSIWRHIDDREVKRTCKHLRALRGEKAELGRVGEDGIKRSDAKLNELLLREKQQQQARAQPQLQQALGAGGPVGTPPLQPGGDNKRRAEAVDGGGGDANKRPNTNGRP